MYVFRVGIECNWYKYYFLLDTFEYFKATF